MIKVFLADDHSIVREGLALLLQQEPDIEVIGQAGDGEEALKQILQLRPDIAILDISMPKLNGIETAEQLVSEGFQGKLLMLTQYDKQEYIHKAIQVGTHGYILKDTIKDDVIDA